MIQNQNRHNDHEWMNIIHECRNSGLTDKEWCSEHNIPMSTFYSSLKRLRDKACEIPVSKGKAYGDPQQVVPLRIIDERSDDCSDILSAEQAVISITAGKFCIDIHSHADRETIYNTLLALQQIC